MDVATRDLAAVSHYSIQWAGNSGFSGATTVTIHAGANSLSTPASVTTLYVRWASDNTSQSHATWTGGTCTPPTTPPNTHTTPPTTPPTVAPTETPFESLLGETAVPGSSATPPPTGTGGNGSGNNSMPLVAMLISLAFGGLGVAAVGAQRRDVRR